MRTPTLFDAELALDRLEARLAAELPAHMAALARAHAGDSVAPSTLAITAREVDAVIASRTFDELRARGTRILRVIAPMVIETAPSVIAAFARERTWESYRALAAARDEQARLRFGRSHRALVHELAGVSGRTVDAASRSGAPSPIVPPIDAPFVPPIAAPIDAWRRSDRDAMTDDSIREAWDALRTARHGALSIARSHSAHPRTFVVERGVRAIIVVPARVDSLAARFAVLHELGHARLWLAPESHGYEWPRAVDEASASHVARAMEASTSADDNEVASAARQRRLGIAHVLDAIEAGGDPGDLEQVPWALWNDPHAQAAYIEAERIADELRAHGAIQQLVARADAIDARDW